VPVFNTRIAVTFAGESAKLVTAEFQKFSRDVGGHLDGMKKSIRSVEGDLKGLKKLLGGALVGRVLVQGAIEALGELDRQFKILGPNGRDALDGVSEAAKGLMSLDIAGFAKGLSKSFAAAWLEIDGTADAIARAEAETRKNQANAERSFAYRRRAADDGIKQIFGNPEELEKQARDLAGKISLALQSGLKANELSKGEVRDTLDKLERAGQVVPPELGKIAAAWGVVSSATAKAREESKRHGEEATRRAEQLKAKLSDLAVTIGEKFAEIQAKQQDALIKSVLDSPESQQFEADLARANQLISDNATAEERRLAAIAEAARLNERFPQFAETFHRILLKNADTFTVMADRAAEIRDAFAKAQRANFAAARDSLISSTGAAFGAAVNAALTRGNVADAFVDALKQGVASVASQLVQNLVTTALQQLVASAAPVVAAETANTTALATNTAALAANTAALGGSTAASGAGAAAGAGSAGGGGWLAAAWPVLAVAAFMVGAKWYSDQKEKKRYGSTANVGLNEGGQYWAVGSGRNPGSAGQLAQGILDLLREIESASGAFITGMDQVLVHIRNDKKRFEVVGVGVFKTMEEALVAAAKQAFSSAQLSGEIAPAIREMVQNFAAKTVEEFKTALTYVKQIVDEASGLSEVELHIKQLPSLIRGVKEQLIAFGVSANEALSLSARWGVEHYRSAWNQISGQQMSPKEELEMKRNQARLLLATMQLQKLEYEARVRWLQVQMGLARVEWGGGGNGTAGGGFRNVLLKAQVAHVQASAKLANTELNVKAQYLGARADLVRGEAQIYQAELDVLAQALKALDELIAQVEVGIGGIRLGGGGRRRGGAGGAANDNTLWDLLLGDRSTLSPQHQLNVAARHFNELKSKDAKRDFAGTYLGEAQSFYGNTAAYDVIYRQVIAAIGGAKYLPGNTEADARRAATTQLSSLASAANTAATALLRLGGRKTAARTSSGSSTGGTLGSLDGLTAILSPASAPSGATLSPTLSGGSGTTYSPDVATALRTQSAAQADGLGAIADAIDRVRRTTRTGGGGTTTTSAPPPPPPPTGGTTYDSTRIDRTGMNVA
jgi:hypothetical protein